MTNLCQFCKVLQFDDSLCGGHVGRSDTNEAVLAFADDQIDERENEEGAIERVMELHYRREDMLPDMPGLEETAADGCQFCPFLRRKILENVRHEHGEDTNGSLKFLDAEYLWVQAIQDSGTHPYSWNLELKFIFQLDGPKWVTDVRFRIYPPPGSLATWLDISSLPHPNDIWTPEKISWVNDSISECIQSCDHKQPSDSLPTRLIHVGTRTGNKFGNPRLVVTTKQKELRKNPPKYATLSYCWGDSAAILKTEKANLKDHLKEIRLEDMAATCRDAILVARAIGIQWLWIDSLCILQDDTGDWEREASRMAEVYANAFLTIVPVRNDSSSQSFLTQRESEDYVDVFFNSVVDPNVQGVFTVRNISLDIPITGDISDLLFNEVNCSKWVRRGWTFQESLMSFRRLYFGHSGIYFECEHMTKTDHGEPSPEGTYMAGDWVNQIRLDEDKESILNRHWYWNITRYSGRYLTFPKDLLPAVSAIAKIVSDKIEDEYLCGLWRSDLPKGLSWTIISAGHKSDHQKHIDNISSLQEEDYIGPSWSWTNPCSKRQYIEWTDWTGIPKCHIRETKSVVKGNNPFGRIERAHILIKGRSRPLPGPKLYHNHRPGVVVQCWTVVEDGYFTAECYLDWNVNEGLEDFIEEEQEEDDDKEYPRRRVLTAASASWLNDLVMLLVGKDSRDQTLSGLLIVRAEKENEWYRVGVFYELSGEYEGNDPLQNWETSTFKLV